MCDPIRFVTMEAVSGALAAIDNVNGFLLGGKKLVVDIKLSKEETAKRKDWNNVLYTVIFIY